MYKYEYVAIVLEMESVAHHYVMYHAHKHTTCNHDLYKSFHGASCIIITALHRGVTVFIRCHSFYRSDKPGLGDIVCYLMQSSPREV